MSKDRIWPAGYCQPRQPQRTSAAAKSCRWFPSPLTSRTPVWTWNLAQCPSPDWLWLAKPAFLMTSHLRVRMTRTEWRFPCICSFSSQPHRGGSTELHVHDPWRGRTRCLLHSYFFFDIQDLYTLLSLPQRHLRTPCPVSDLAPDATISRKAQGRISIWKYVNFAWK